jgi:hypothetical protein
LKKVGLKMKEGREKGETKNLSYHRSDERTGELQFHPGRGLIALLHWGVEALKLGLKLRFPAPAKPLLVATL